MIDNPLAHRYLGTNSNNFLPRTSSETRNCYRGYLKGPERGTKWEGIDQTGFQEKLTGFHTFSGQEDIMKYYEANNELPGKLKFKVNYYLLKIFQASI